MVAASVARAVNMVQLVTEVLWMRTLVTMVRASGSRAVNIVQLQTEALWVRILVERVTALVSRAVNMVQLETEALWMGENPGPEGHSSSNGRNYGPVGD